MFEPGEVYVRRRDIHGKYGGQWQGGISTPSDFPAVFLFTGEVGETFGYRDEFRPDGTFWYTGEGQRGDMEMTRGNLAIRDHEANGRALHLFEKTLPRGSVRYIGPATYLGHHIEQRPDIDGGTRDAFVFELAVTMGETGDSTAGLPLQNIEERDLWKQTLVELRKLANERASSTLTAVERRVMTRVRSAAVKVYVLRRANGVCECCAKPAPFLTNRGRPYLEPHHIRRVADGGPDDPAWVAAVCPNCHREIHHGEHGSSLNARLAVKIPTLESSLCSEGESVGSSTVPRSSG